MWPLTRKRSLQFVVFALIAVCMTCISRSNRLGIHSFSALFYFPQEQKTGIAPTRIILTKRTRFNYSNGGDCQLGQRESWSGDTLCVWNFYHKNNVCFAVLAVPFTQSHCYSSFTCQLRSVTHYRNGCMTKCCFFLTQNNRRHAQTLWFMFLRGEEKFALFLKLWISMQYRIRKWSSRSFL